jgi:hypothetical protein
VSEFSFSSIAAASSTPCRAGFDFEAAFPEIKLATGLPHIRRVDFEAEINL